MPIQDKPRSLRHKSSPAAFYGSDRYDSRRDMEYKPEVVFDCLNFPAKVRSHGTITTGRFFQYRLQRRAILTLA